MIFCSDQCWNHVCDVGGQASKVEDNTITDRVVENEEDYQIIQKDINHVEVYTEKYQMEFNPGTCEVGQI